MTGDLERSEPKQAVFAADLAEKRVLITGGTSGVFSFGTGTVINRITIVEAKE